VRVHRRLLATTALVGVAALSSGCAQVKARLQARVAVRPVSTVSVGDSPTESAIVARVNHVRVANHLAPLSVHPTLVNKARLWSHWMAAGGCGQDANGVHRICHSSLVLGISVPWTMLEENVGSGAPRSIALGVENGFENSPTHMANILNARVHYIGVGVAYWGDHVYVTQEFMAT
jgi:uncharacterized protein YkwD